MLVAIMTWSKVGLLAILSDNSYIKRKYILKNKKRKGIHNINRARKIFGEFHHLYTDLIKDKSRFFEYLRMSVETFDFILRKIEKRLQKQKTNYKDPISPTERLYTTIRYLSTGLSFRNLAFSLRMGATTVENIVHEVCTVLWLELVAEFMPVPSTQHLEKIAIEYYNRWGFPNCIGSIDGKHCQIKCPSNSGSSYFNYLKYFSLVLQAVADADKKFVTIEVGARGKQSDGGTFASSKLFQMLENNTFNVPTERNLPGNNIKVPFILIGDEAYPLKPYLMRPYPSRGLNQMKEKFNACLSLARKGIECAFGILRAKWRILGKDIEVSPEKAAVIIKCACILHNVIREKDGNSDLDYMTEITRQNAGLTNEIDDRRRGTNASNRAKDIRSKLTNYFFENR